MYRTSSAPRRWSRRRGAAHLPVPNELRAPASARAEAGRGSGKVWSALQWGGTWMASPLGVRRFRGTWRDGGPMKGAGRPGARDTSSTQGWERRGEARKRAPFHSSGAPQTCRRGLDLPASGVEARHAQGAMCGAETHSTRPQGSLRPPLLDPPPKAPGARGGLDPPNSPRGTPLLPSPRGAERRLKGGPCSGSWAVGTFPLPLPFPARRRPGDFVAQVAVRRSAPGLDRTRVDTTSQGRDR